MKLYGCKAQVLGRLGNPKGVPIRKPRKAMHMHARMPVMRGRGPLQGVRGAAVPARYHTAQAIVKRAGTQQMAARRLRDATGGVAYPTPRTNSCDGLPHHKPLHLRLRIHHQPRFIHAWCSQHPQKAHATQLHTPAQPARTCSAQRRTLSAASCPDVRKRHRPPHWQHI